MKNKTVGAYTIIKNLPSRNNNSYVLVRCVRCRHKKETRKYDFLRSSGKCSNCGYMGIGQNISRSSKWLFKKQNKKQICSNCGIDKWNGLPLKMDIDHIVPLSNGGEDSIDNMCYLCPNCHRQKTDKERQELQKKKVVF